MELNTRFDPFPVLHAPHVSLRRIVAADAPSLLKWRSDPLAMRYIDRPLARDISEIESLIQQMDTGLAAGDSIMWGISLPDRLIGNIGFWQMKKAHFRAEIGYLLDPDHWGKGIMNEAMDAVLRYGFEVMGLHSIEAVTNPENTASRRLLEKNGFRQEAYFREDYYFDGAFLDSVVYGLLAADRKG